MAYSQSKKPTAQEKKLAILRTQLYGKEQPEIAPKQAEKPTAFKFNSPGESPTPVLPNTHPETTYLKNDLQKIAILATIIFSVQVLLYLSLNRGLINF